MRDVGCRKIVRFLTVNQCTCRWFELCGHMDMYRVL